MCEISEERTYYIRTSLMYTDLTREVLFKVFKFLIKSEDIIGFITSQEQQNILREQLQKNVINKSDFNLVSGQILNLERFDISLLIRLILNLCKDKIPKPQRGWETKLDPKDESLGADLLRLRDVRNKIIGHRSDAKLSEAEYEKTWAKIKAILLRVVELVDSKSSENFEQRIDEYKRLNVDTENAEVKRLLDELLNYKREYDHLQEKVEELSRRSQEFQIFFKTTPESYVRYIKLLFDGGRIVLCGILEKKLSGQDLSDFLTRKRETLSRNNEEIFSSCLNPQEYCSDYTKWDVFHLASILLLTCDEELSQKEIMYIERIKCARINYAALALQSLDTVDFLTNWIDLINCLNHLSINIAEDDRQKVESLIERYKEKDEGGCDAEEYFKQLRESGVEVKTLNDVYNETIKELRDMLNKLSQKDFKFEKGYVLEFKLLTICENEEIKKEAEDLLEINLQASIQKSDQPSGPIREETDKVVAIIAAHPDVTPVEVKRKCIIWSLKCSTPGGLLHILDVTDGDQFRNTFRNIAYEMHYIYGYAFLIQGKYTLESVSMISRMINKSTTYESSSEQIRIPLKCSSVDGISSVLSAIKLEMTTNSLNRIAEQMSAEFKETVSIRLLPEMMEFGNVFKKTVSEESSSPDRNEYETEKWVPDKMDETDKDVLWGHAVDKQNAVSAAQSSYDDKMAEYAIENEEPELKTACGFSRNTHQTRIKNVIVDVKRTESELGSEGSSLPGRKEYKTGKWVHGVTDFRILLVGRTGHGKSSTGNSIIGKDVFQVSAGSKSKTKTCQFSHAFKRFGKVVEVVDTPALSDTDLDQSAVHKELLKALVLTTPGYNIIAFVLMKGKFTEEMQKTQDLFFKWFGKDVEKFSCIILTDTDSDEDKERYIKDDPHPKLAELVQTCNGNVVALNNKNIETKKQNQIKKLFEVAEKIKHDNCDTHFSYVIFQVAESYMNSKYPNKLTKESIRIFERFDFEQFSQCQRDRLQQLFDMLTEDDDSEDMIVETDEDSIDNDLSSPRKVDKRADCGRGNLPIYDYLSNERILNIQVPNQVLRQKTIVTGSNDVASSNVFGYSYKTANTDEVPGKSSEYVASNIMRDQLDAKQHLTYQIESDEHFALMQGSSQSKTDGLKFREKRGMCRENRGIDIESVRYDAPQSSRLDELKEIVNDGEHEEELGGLLGYTRKGWKFGERNVCVIL